MQKVHTIVLRKVKSAELHLAPDDYTGREFYFFPCVIPESGDYGKWRSGDIAHRG